MLALLIAIPLLSVCFYVFGSQKGKRISVEYVCIVYGCSVCICESVCNLCLYWVNGAHGSSCDRT